LNKLAIAELLMIMANTITLLTDFGTQDGYVGAMKGAIACIHPSPLIIDLSHDIPPQDIAAARYVLMSAYSSFPVGTIHVAVVDPGVGSWRRAIAIQLEDGFLIGPDNGIFSGVLQTHVLLQVVELTNSQYWRTETPSQTFHGRDIFAPVAAHLANGVPLMALGKAIAPDSLITLAIPEPTLINSEWIGAVQYCDRFGNAVTNLAEGLLQTTNWHVLVTSAIAPETEVVIPGVNHYGAVAVGDALAIVGSSGWIEIAMNRGNARQKLGLEIGTTVRLVQ
jgi:S-adenosyl-L-methionine hydrolase (adenosine-forming)